MNSFGTSMNSQMLFLFFFGGVDGVRIVLLDKIATYTWGDSHFYRKSCRLNHTLDEESRNKEKKKSNIVKGKIRPESVSKRR